MNARRCTERDSFGHILGERRTKLSVERLNWTYYPACRCAYCSEQQLFLETKSPAFTSNTEKRIDEF
jgi:hypothetical protein